MFQNILKMNQTIAEQLARVPDLKKLSRIAYYEDTPGKQIHMDTMFWNSSGESATKLVPILVIVDVATKFVQYYQQETKNEKVLEHYTDFKAQLTKRFPNTTEDSLIITDDAKELAAPFKKHPHVRQKVSTGMNKAALAEVKIAQLRKRLRAIELELNINNVKDDIELRINKETLPLILPDLTYDINIKAKQMERPKDPGPQEELRIGTPVFLINLHKYFPYQLKDVLRKKSYDQNWYYEPFSVVGKTKVNGIIKYQLIDLIRGDMIKYHFYRDQLQVIDPTVSQEYVKKWRNYHEKRETTEFF